MATRSSTAFFASFSATNINIAGHRRAKRRKYTRARAHARLFTLQQAAQFFKYCAATLNVDLLVRIDSAQARDHVQFLSYEQLAEQRVFFLHFAHYLLLAFVFHVF